MVEDFAAGRFPMEGHLTLAGGGDGPDSPDWVRSWRWCDVKAIWIEEA